MEVIKKIQCKLFTRKIIFFTKEEVPRSIANNYVRIFENAKQFCL